jgi:two-component system chemotaxis response regulator CheB
MTVTIMGKVRVLVVEDSVVMRRIITEILSEDPNLEVVGTAANGRLALMKLSQVNPDVVTLDVEMPEMDGLECLRELRKTHPRLPVIMFSTVTEKAASATLDALALGANDYVTKPSKVADVAAAWDHVRHQLAPKILHFGTPVGARTQQRPAPMARAVQPAPRSNGATAEGPAATPAPPPRSGGRARTEIVTIGVSTGGPNALAALLPRLPEDLSVPVAIVQHMPPMFTRMLADRLSAVCKLPVHEAADGARLEPGHVYLAPGDYHLTVERQGGDLRLRTNQDPPENYCRPAVDVLFQSAARVFGPSVLALVLTGMGQDGLRGCRSIKEAGGRILVQDQASSVVWGMPGAVFDAGLTDGAYALDRLADEVMLAVRRNGLNVNQAAGAEAVVREATGG